MSSSLCFGAEGFGLETLPVLLRHSSRQVRFRAPSDALPELAAGATDVPACDMQCWAIGQAMLEAGTHSTVRVGSSP